MSAYWDQKSTHKYVYATLNNGGISRSNNTACHVENKTSCFKGSFKWDTVTCKRCLKKKVR